MRYRQQWPRFGSDICKPTFSLTKTVGWVDGQNDAREFLPSGKTQYPSYGRLGGPQYSCGKSRPSRIQKLDQPPIASRYTEWATAAHREHKSNTFYNQGTHKITHHESGKVYIGHTWRRCKTIYAEHTASKEKLWYSTYTYQ